MKINLKKLEFSDPKSKTNQNVAGESGSSKILWEECANIFRFTPWRVGRLKLKDKRKM